MTELVDVILGGTFHAAVLFLVAAGLQLVFGVQKIVNLACGSFYALGAYFGITAVGIAIRLGMPPVLFLPVLIVAGLAIGLVGLPIERVLRTTAENRDMAEGLGVNASKIFALVFTVGCMLGTVGGALVVPSGAASLDMAVELVVESFAVVVIGGLGSMRGALVGALVVGLMRAAAISLVPELEMLSVYLVCRL